MNHLEIRRQFFMLFSVIFFTLKLFPQTDVLLSQQWSMPTLYNPASTGDTDFIRFRGGARLQSLGIYHSPKNILGTIDSPFKISGKRIGAGVVVNAQNYDLYRNILVGAQGSYKFKIRNSQLSVGLQLGYYHSKYKGSEYIINNSNNGNQDGGSSENPNEEDDPDYEDGTFGDDDLLPTHDVGGGAFDISIGLKYEHPKFYLGLSGLHLTNSKIKLSTEGESSGDSRYIETKLPITLYFDGGGNIAINNSLFTLQPSLCLLTDFKDFTSVVEMRATYNQKFTFGIDYRWNQAVGVIAGITVKNFFLGYAWEYDYRPEAKRSTGNHEFIIGYQFKLDMGGKNLFSHRSIRLM